MWIYSLSFAILLAPTLVQATRSLLDKAFDDYVEKLIDKKHVPGLSLALIDSGNITSRGYGFSKLPSTRATADTLYFTGSTTKAFTAAAAGFLVEDKEKFADVKWTTPLINLLPESFALSSDFATLHTTLEDALSHRSGLPRHDWAYGWGNSTTADVIKTFRHLPLSAEPRTRWQYCNLMFAAVGEVVYRLTGENLGTILKEWIWEPLGMISTTFDIHTAIDSVNDRGESRLARGYHWVQESNSSKQNEKDDCYFVPDPYYDLLPHVGAGATISSVNDYALWIKALLSTTAGAGSPTKVNDSCPISVSLYRDLVSPRMIMSETSKDASQEAFTAPKTYALGWEVARLGSRLIVQHGGGIPGFVTSVFFFPK